MKIIIDIPKEFETDYNGDKFKDFFSRVLRDIDKGVLCGNYEKETAEMFLKAFDESVPMANIVEKLEEKTEFLKDCTKYGNKSAEQQEKSYSTMMMYEVADLVDDLIDIVKQEINKEN
jgi:hypothetical protein